MSQIILSLIYLFQIVGYRYKDYIFCCKLIKCNEEKTTQFFCWKFLHVNLQNEFSL